MDDIRMPIWLSAEEYQTLFSSIQIALKNIGRDHQDFPHLMSCLDELGVAEARGLSSYFSLSTLRKVLGKPHENIPVKFTSPEIKAVSENVILPISLQGKISH